jgi:plasmid stabilization system protein ParE
VTHIRITPEADAQIMAVAAWWRENRSAAPGLFPQELAAGIAQLRAAPRIGRRMRRRHIPELRRLLLRATRYHVYYAPSPDGDTLFILAVWNACRGIGPKIAWPQR